MLKKLALAVLFVTLGAVTAFAAGPAVAAGSVAIASVVATGEGEGSEAGSREHRAAGCVDGGRGDLRDHRRRQERTGSRNLTDHATTPVCRGVAWLLTCHRSALPRAR